LRFTTSASTANQLQPTSELIDRAHQHRNEPVTLSITMPRPSLLIACACVLLALVATQASAAKFNASTTCGFEGYDFR